MRARKPRARFAALPLLAVLGVVGIAGVLSAMGSASMATADDGIGITVTVAPIDTQLPTESLGDGSSAAASGSGASGNGSGYSGSGDSGSVDPLPVDETPVSNPTSTAASRAAGILNVGGLNSHYNLSANPADNAVTLNITVRNNARSTFSSTARFWMQNAVGATVGQTQTVSIRALKPGTTRTVSVTLAGAGQWTLLHGHVTVTPPRTIDGVKVASISRDSFVLVPPLLLGGGALGIGLLLWARYLWRARVASLAAVAP